MITLKLSALAPLRIGDSAGVIRDSMGLRPCIPASTLKGRLRSEVERLAATFDKPICKAPHRASMCHALDGLPCIACQLFGSPWSEGRLFFEDLIASKDPILVMRQHGARSRLHGVVHGASSNQYEMLPAGTVFSGRIRHGLRELSQVALTVAALRAISTFGVGYGVGWGTCSAEVSAFDTAGHLIEPRKLAEALQTDFATYFETR